MKLRKITLLCLVLVALVCMCPGCESTPAERVAAAKALINQAIAISQKMDAGVADIEKVIADCQLSLQDPNIPAETREDIGRVLELALARLAKLKAEKQKAVSLIEKWQSILDQVDPNDVTFEKELELYTTGAGQAAQYLPPQYRGYLILATALVTLFGSAYKNYSQAQQLKDDRKKTTELVISVDSLLESDLVKDQGEAKKLLASKQPTVSAIVDAIHDPMKNTGP